MCRLFSVLASRREASEERRFTRGNDQELGVRVEQSIAGSGVEEYRLRVESKLMNFVQLNQPESLANRPLSTHF